VSLIGFVAWLVFRIEGKDESMGSRQASETPAALISSLLFLAQ
jgi:hypothetical protein